METTLKGRKAAVESVLDDLRTLVDAEDVSAGPEAASPFLRSGGPRLLPGCSQRVQFEPS
jgi:hypothetical protein